MFSKNAHNNNILILCIRATKLWSYFRHIRSVCGDYSAPQRFVRNALILFINKNDQIESRSVW